SAATLNRKDISTTLENGHLILPAAALQSSNELKLTFTSNIAPAGKAFTRYEDRDDHNEYIYTLFVPMDADMAFPCFDQPDLKARFALEVGHPTDWTVIANTAPFRIAAYGQYSVTTFHDTQPISTYLSPSPPAPSNLSTENFPVNLPFTSASRNSFAHKPKRRRCSR